MKHFCTLVILMLLCARGFPQDSVRGVESIAVRSKPNNATKSVEIKFATGTVFVYEIPSYGVFSADSFNSRGTNFIVQRSIDTFDVFSCISLGQSIVVSHVGSISGPYKTLAFVRWENQTVAVFAIEPFELDQEGKGIEFGIDIETHQITSASRAPDLTVRFESQKPEVQWLRVNVSDK